MFNKKDLNRLYRYCCALCDDNADAFDLLQMSLEKCLKRPPQDPEALHSYMRRIIRNSFIDNLRSNAKLPLEEFDETTHGTVDHDIQSLESVLIKRGELEAIWPSLSSVEREIVFLSAIEGYSTTEISELINKPKNSILSIVHRMRIRLSNNQDTRVTGEKTQ